jgi:hypothetical protein
MSARVYIVCRGERGEGHSPVAVFTTLNVARRWAEREYDIRREVDGGPGWWLWSCNGVDEVAIARLDVRRSAT